LRWSVFSPFLYPSVFLPVIALLWHFHKARVNHNDLFTQPKSMPSLEVLQEEIREPINGFVFNQLLTVIGNGLPVRHPISGRKTEKRPEAVAITDLKARRIPIFATQIPDFNRRSRDRY